MLFLKHKYLFIIAVFGGLAMACSTHSELEWKQEQGYRWAEVSTGYFGGPGFSIQDTNHTNINFENRVLEQSIKENRVLLNGSGVAAGDIDGDGLADLYFARLEGPNRLYKNMGGFEFRDITEEAGVAHTGFNSTGTVFADVDGDFDLDLLVSSLKTQNHLYINNGKGQFSLRTDSGLGKSRGSTTMALADIDDDGDLDLYVTNYKAYTAKDVYTQRELGNARSVNEEGNVKVASPFDEDYRIVQTNEGTLINEFAESDELYLNRGDGTFEKADDLERRFIDADGRPLGLPGDWGLTAKFHDINGDRLPDLYVCNDFWTPDRVWINQGKGVFKAIDSRAIRSLSFSSMAVDFSDVDRDGSVDIFVAEMLSDVHQQRMRQLSDYLKPVDGRPLFNKNSMYLNRGDGTFAEIAYLSGLAATGWSWATHFMDIDLDGYEDIIINTGNGYDYQDIDTQINLSRQASQSNMKEGVTEYPPLALQNKFYRNQTDLTFSDKSSVWGFTGKDISHGLASADLDNDGDLDFAVNRLNSAAAVYKNESVAPRIAVRLKGNKPNTQAIGATIELKGGPVVQQKQVVSGGEYVSGSDPLVVFAAEERNINHILNIMWPDGRQSRIDSVQANRIYEIDLSSIAKTGQNKGQSGESEETPVFKDISGRLNHDHHENDFNDFRIQPLLPIKLSEQGPGIAWIDADRDGDDDLFIGSGKGGNLATFENLGKGQFSTSTLEQLNDEAPADQTAILGWGSEEGMKFVIGNSSYERDTTELPAAHEYDITDGKVTGQEGIQDVASATGPLAAADYDGDGDIDLFVGGRFIPGRYPRDASSRLFINERGSFVLDKKNSRKLAALGLVTGAVFSDYDQDGDQDLFISREWDSILLFENENGNFQNISSEVGLAEQKGWWNGITTGDFNTDGLPDFIATNIGLNSIYQITEGFPLKMFYDDFNRDGNLDIIDAYYDRTSSAYVPRRRLYNFRSVPTILRNVENYRDFAQSSVEDIFGRDFSGVPFKEINRLQSMLFLNDGEEFIAHPLPIEAQFTKSYSAGVADYNNDGYEDLFVSQNSFVFPPDIPNQNAGRGLWLKGDGAGDFETIPGHKTGITAYGEQRGAALSDFDKDGRVDLALSQNGGETKLYQNSGDRAGIRVQLVGPASNRDAIGSSMRLVYSDESKGPRREIQAGSGYWSQNSTTQVLGAEKEPAGIEVTWFNGKTEFVEIIQGKQEYVIWFHSQ